MNFPLVPEYKTDLLHVNPDNQKRGEPFTLERSTYSRILVPRHAPAFANSVRLYNANRQELVKGKDWRIFKIMPALTELAATSVTCMIEVMNTEVLSGFIDYDIVGEFSLFDESLMQMIAEMVGQDIDKVSWDQIRNKPEWFKPKLHGHNLIYDIMYFKDFVDLLDGVLTIAKTQGRTVVEAKISHYFNTFTNYINAYKTEIKAKLDAHKAAYNAHGLNKAQIGLPLVDNFGTVRGVDALVKRSDKHLTPTGLKAIIRTQATDLDKLLPVNQLPISQFGNSNFIPASIDGSFEGLGGQFETAAISMENDGSLVFLENRFDGRVEGLYYSVVEKPNSSDRNEMMTRLYTGYRYTHQRIENDDARVNRIAQGSGDEVILMADSRKGYFYIGLTHGSLDPAKHVLSRIDLTPLLADLPSGSDLNYYVRYMNVFKMGDWIFVTLCHGIFADSANADSAELHDLRYRSFWRVSTAMVEAQLPVTASRLNLTFVDGDGVQKTNVPKWNICTPVPDLDNPGPTHFRKYYWNFKQKFSANDNLQTAGLYRSQLTFVTENPNKPGIYVIKIMGGFWAQLQTVAINSTFITPLEITYEMNPETGVMTLLHQTNKQAGELDMYNLPVTDPANMQHMVFAYSAQGAAVLNDGTIVSSYSAYLGFPRGWYIFRPANYKNRYDVISRRWEDQLGEPKNRDIGFETIISPIKSGVRPKAFLLGNKGDFYVASYVNSENYQKLFYRASSGRIASQPNVTNIKWEDVRCRPLRNTVSEVRGSSRVGGAFVSVPSAQLSAFNIDLADNTFCLGIQKSFLKLDDQSNEWPVPSEEEGISLVADHTTRTVNGILEIVPTSTIYYPASIVELLKREVEDVPGMLGSPNPVVNICDPTGRLTNKFGWLPVLVMINWAKLGTITRYQTMLSIVPTYSGGTNKTVTGYTVLDKIHKSFPGYAIGVTPTGWIADISGPINVRAHGPMRVGYYLDGNEIKGYFDTGVQSPGSGDIIQAQGEFYYPDRTTKRWGNPNTPNYTYIEAYGNTGAAGQRSVVPDLGVVLALPNSDAGGGAAALFRRVDNTGFTAILGSVYPEVGWIVFFKQPIKAVFNGIPYVFPDGNIDLRTVDPSPGNKTFYIYAMVEDGVPTYVVAQDQRLESPFQVWVAKVITNATQIIEIERFNVFAINGNRISELKRGGSIPATSGLASKEGQLPWIRDNELIP